MIKQIVFVILMVFFAISCRDECKEVNKRLLYGYPAMSDPNPNSPYFNQTVLFARVYINAMVEQGKTCKGATCIDVADMVVGNRSPQDMEVTLSLVGRGDFTYFIAKGDSIQVSPFPDFCKDLKWGTVKEIKYK
jgi:hypothetical protein